MLSAAWKRQTKSAALAIAALLLAAALPVATQEKPYPQLDQQLQPLKNQFNTDELKVRLILLLDPT